MGPWEGAERRQGRAEAAQGSVQKQGLSLSPVCLSSLLWSLPQLLPCLEPGRHLDNWRYTFLLITAQEACG